MTGAFSYQFMANGGPVLAAVQYGYDVIYFYVKGYVEITIKPKSKLMPPARITGTLTRKGFV